MVLLAQIPSNNSMFLLWDHTLNMVAARYGILICWRIRDMLIWRMCRNLLAGLLPLARMQAVANDLLELLISSPCKNADSCMHAKLVLLLPCHFRNDTFTTHNSNWANHHQSLSYNFQFLFGHTNNYSYLYSFAPHATSLWSTFSQVSVIAPSVKSFNYNLHS